MLYNYVYTCRFNMHPTVPEGLKMFKNQLAQKLQDYTSTSKSYEKETPIKIVNGVELDQHFLSDIIVSVFAVKTSKNNQRL